MFFMSYIPCAIVLAVYLEEEEQPVQTSRVLNPRPLPHLFTELPPPTVAARPGRVPPHLAERWPVSRKNESSRKNVHVD